MKMKTAGLIVAVTIVAVVMFAGCVEEKQVKQVKKYSNLEITEVSYESGQVKIFGATYLLTF